MDAREHPFDVVVVGNAGIDTNVYLPGNEIDFTVEANFTENIDLIGQAGGYAARGYHRLGWRTAFIGALGADFSGRFIHESFTAEGINLDAVFLDPAGTSRSVNVMYPDGRRKNFYDGKSHLTLHPDIDACRAVLAGARLVHFNIPNWARLLLPVARQLGVVVAVDLQDVVDPLDPYRQDFIRGADILFFSAVNHVIPDALMRAFWEVNTDLLIVSGMGERGCAIGVSEIAARPGDLLPGIHHFPAVQLPAPVIDTNGAGDSLAASFLSSFVLQGCTMLAAIRRGQIAARHTCTLRGDSTNLITQEQLNDYV